MRALTLTQPFAGLVAAGVKPIENRSRSMIHPRDFGKPFAIHASREVDMGVYDMLRELAPELMDGDVTEMLWYRLSRIQSSIIGVSTVDRRISPGLLLGPESAASLREDERRWYFGKVGYVLRDSKPLMRADQNAGLPTLTPLPCRGWQGFWTLSPQLEAAVLSRI